MDEPTFIFVNSFAINEREFSFAHFVPSLHIACGLATATQFLH